MNIAFIRQSLVEEGYAIVEELIDTKEKLESLRLECETLLELALTGTAPWNHGEAASCVIEAAPPSVLQAKPLMRTCVAAYSEYRCKWPFRPEVIDLVRGPSELVHLVTEIYGSSAVLMNEQYIVKPGGTDGMQEVFPWHRDSQWLSQEASIRSEYISVWIALDNANRDNGCLVVKPRSHIAGDAECKPPKALEVAAGTAVIMTESIEHCSGSNKTPFARRVWMPQFSRAPIIDSNTSLPVSLALELH